MLLAKSGFATEDTFVVSDIRIEGLQRIPVERVYSQLPIDVGDQVDARRLALALRTLFKSGDFQDIQIGREGDVLVVLVAERPAVSDIEIKGNKIIDEDALLEGLKGMGLYKGSVFHRSALATISGELKRQYVALGRYSARVDTTVIPQPRNRVKLEINIIEGKVAKIVQVNIVGNHAFSDKQLLDQMELKSSHFWSFFKGDNKYSKEKLAGDLEALRSWYMDQGYINFALESTLISISEDNKQVYIDITLHEGDAYKVSEVTLSGNLVVPKAELEKLLFVEPGQIFSQKKITTTNELLSRRLGNDGYLFADVNGIPDVDEENKTVSLNFFVSPKNRIYVNRINFLGNVKTKDEVLRREMRQFEAGPANTSAIEVGRQRLMRLGFFSKAEAETPLVPGTEDEVDVTYNVEEQPSGSVGANVGYSENNGFTFGANVSQDNFWGTGNRVSFAINQSEVRNSYNFSFFDPYFTDDGVSRGYDIFYSETDYSKTPISTYNQDIAGGAVNFGYPISETERLNFTFEYDNIQITTGASVAINIRDFIEEHGDRYNTFTTSASWRESTLNKGILPDRGLSQSLRAVLAMPGSDVTFYKLIYRGQRYFPLYGDWVFRARAKFGYGNGYGNSAELPFYKNFFAGGIGSVRGYEPRSLGPTSPSAVFYDADLIDPSPNPIGGNLLTEGSMELIFPAPFLSGAKGLRTAMYLDGGNVFQTEGDTKFSFDTKDIRYAYGIGLTWYTAIGPLGFTFSRVFNEQPGDDIKNFQFTLGQVF